MKKSKFLAIRLTSVSSLIVLSCLAFGQKSDFLSGFSLDIGVGYNTCSWENNSTMFNDDTIFKRNAFWIQPNFRVRYMPDLWKSDNGITVSIGSFVGFNSFGGKSRTEPNGYRDYFLFKSIEAGLLPTFISSRFQFLAGIKGQLIVDSKTKHYGSLVQPYGVPREWGTDDVDQLFKNFSMSAGLGFHYVLNRIDFGIESWFGLMNLSEIDAVDLKVKENNFRLLFGYKF